MNSERFEDIPDKVFSEIINYLNGELAAEGNVAFERRIADDIMLQRQVMEVKALLVGVREAALERQLTKFHRGAFVNKRASERLPVRHLSRWWAAASVVAFMLVGAWWLWVSVPSDGKLFQQYFVPDAGLPVEMGSADSLEYVFFDGMISYKEENYADALEKWRALASVTGETDTLDYYMGVAEMAQDNIENAVGLLSGVASQRVSVFYTDANWYLALCYLHRGDRKAASAILRRIADREDVMELLKKLE